MNLVFDMHCLVRGVQRVPCGPEGSLLNPPSLEAARRPVPLSDRVRTLVIGNSASLTVEHDGSLHDAAISVDHLYEGFAGPVKPHAFWGHRHFLKYARSHSPDEPGKIGYGGVDRLDSALVISLINNLRPISAEMRKLDGWCQ